MSILIVAQSNDIHTDAVKWGLDIIGADCDVLVCESMPVSTQATYDAQNDRIYLESQSSPFRSNYDVVWNRRTAPVIPHADIHADDRIYAQRIGEAFIRSIREYYDRNALMVNNSVAASIMERKVEQLRHAKDAGLRIPATIISNDLDRVSTFVSKQNGAICKPLMPMEWLEPEGAVSGMTSRVSVSDLQRVGVEGCPMIYQEEIEKILEYRAVVLGSEVILVELDSQASAETSIDWRKGAAQKLGCRRVDMPAGLSEKLLAFMKLSGLIFGSFDLALTPDHDIVFFEINQQGQFLWLEDVNPAVPMLDVMVQFLANASPQFRYSEPAQKLRLTDFSGKLSNDDMNRYRRGPTRPDYTIKYGPTAL